MPAISGFPLTIGLGTSLLVERGRAPRCKAADGVRVGSVFGKVGRWIGVNRALGFGLLFLLLAIRVIDPVPLAALRYAAFDLYQQVKPREYQPLPVAVIDIDDASLAELGQWPWPRDMLADLIDAARAQGVAGIAFDVLFAEPDRLSPDKLAAGRDLPQTLRAEIAALPSTDDLLARAFARARAVAGQSSVRGVGADAVEGADRELADTPHALLGDDPRPFLQRYPQLIENLPEIEAAAAGRGVFATRPDPDGIYRRVPLVMLVEDTLRLGLAPELLRVATGGDAFAIRTNAAGVEGLVLARQNIPTAADGSVWPWLTPSTPARYVSAAALIEGRVPQGRLAGHLVLVGTSAIGLEDFRPTPLGVPMAGVEIHAQVLENILAGSLLVRPNYAVAVELVAALGLMMIVIGLVPIFSAGWVLVLSGVLLSGYGGASVWAFHANRALIDPTFPILSAVLMLMLMSSLNYLREERMRRHIRSAFGQYVSPDLVAQLAEKREALTLGGERRDLTVLFSDVRGFTGLAESYRDDPAALTRLMNRLLTALSEAILEEQGTIDKFMGDAVMAFWNAPLNVADHAHAGCSAALGMVEKVDALNAARAGEEPGCVPVDIGIGLNTGPCVVGNMGSEMRFDYTALGDTVNLASRLEGQSKPYGVKIVLGEAVAEAVRDDFALIELDLLRVKGKSLPARVYGCFGNAAMAQSEAFRAVAAANGALRAAYAAQDWPAAGAALDRLSEAGQAAGLDLSVYRALYRDRIAAFEAAPPGEGWDGVFVATSK